ncbi:MAG: hypothetical protein WBP79_16010 [Candidatus Acidiferrales bacterium]
MEIPLEGNGARRALLIVSVAAAALICFQAIRFWLADFRMHSRQLELMERGAAIEPGNAEAWDRLGRLQQWDFANPDPFQAITDYLKAVQYDPHSANYWMDLASAYEAAGDFLRARSAFESARKVYPISAEVSWNYGNFLLRRLEFSEGYAEIQRAVQADPSLLPLAISRTWRSNPDVNQLLDHVLPAGVDAYFQALDFFASIHDTESGVKVWQRLVGLGKPFALSRSFPFLDELIREDRADDAHHVWREALVAAGKTYDEPAKHSLVWNGDFAQDISNGGLDWRWTPPVGVATGFDSAPPSGGIRSFRLDFGGGSNLELGQPTQYVPVEPGHTYRFHAQLRTEGITTESGMRFSIYDPNHAGGVNVLTDNLTGTQTWTASEADVKTSPETHFLVIRIYRPTSRMFDNKLAGTVWIADVSLVPSDAPAGQPTP